MKKLLLIYRWFVALLAMLITGSTGLILVILSFGLLRNFCCKYFINYSSRFILRVMGFKATYPDKREFPKYPVLYTFNHNSYLDIFLLTGIGLSNIRYLLSEKTYVYLPLVLSAKTVGTRYIPQKKHGERRLRFLIKTTEYLKRKKVSIAGSAEGVHRLYHGIAPFNRGIFHMAFEAKLPVVALYIHIPKESNPFKSRHAVGGELKLEVLEEISTSDWSLQNLDDHIDQVRTIYMERFDRLNSKKKIG